jgi:hypothetical protein
MPLSLIFLCGASRRVYFKINKAHAEMARLGLYSNANETPTKTYIIFTQQAGAFKTEIDGN